MTAIRFDDILDALDGPVEVIDDQWRCIYRNEVCAKIHVSVGHDPGYGIGQIYWEVYPRLAGTSVETAIRHAMEKRERAICEFAYPDASHFMLMRAFPTRDGGVAMFFRDITATKRVDERETFLLQLSDRMRSLSDPRAIMRVAAELLGKHLHLAFVQYGVLIDDDTMEISAVYNDGRLPGIVEGVRHRFSERAPAWRELHRAGLAVYTEDRLNDARPLADGTTGTIAMRGGASIPLLKDGRLVAVLGVGLPDPHVWTVSEKEILGEVAERTWATAERARVQTALLESESKYRTLFEEMGEGFMLAELVRNDQGDVVDYRYLEFNRAMEDQTGLTRDKQIGRMRRELFPIPSTAIETYTRVVETQKPERVEVYEPAINRWFALHAFPRGGDTFATLYNDITARKRDGERQKYLLEVSDKLRPLRDAGAILTAATAALAHQLDAQRAYYVEYFETEDYCTIRGEFVRGDYPAMKQTVKLSGFTFVYDKVRHGLPAVVDDWSETEASPESKAILAERGIRSQITVPLLKEGKLVASMSLSDGRPRNWTPGEVALVQETAERTWAALERAKAETALRKLLAQAESANRSKDEFLATLSHELRTPLAAILLWAHALRSDKIQNADRTRAVDAIAQSAESQSALIDDLLDLSRLTAGKLLLSRSPVDVASIARTALNIVRPLVDGKRIALVVDVPGNMGRALLDGPRLKQIMWNLLTNATKFTPEGGKISLRVRRDDNTLELEVSDNGQGIEAELLPRVFDKFWQAEMGEARQHMGLGIGLALTKQLVELHDGTICAQSAGRGQGATFRVRIPWAEASTAMDPTTQTRARQALAGLRVLLVEDDSNTQQAMAWMLRDAGADVVSVDNGKDAIAAVDGDNPASVIVCDLGLPEMSGYDLITRINENYRRDGHAPPPSCAVSAHARDVDRERAIAAGFDMYLAKPIVPERLIEAVVDLRDVLRRVD